VGNVVVDISDMKVSKRPEDVLVTYSLGSCIGLGIYDPVARVGGLIHYMLPLSNVDKGKAKTTPCMFADTGVPLLFEEAYKLGAQKKRLVVKAAGGSQLLDEKGLFNIGKRNHTMLRKIFWKNNVLIDAEDVGGSITRTVFLEIATGRYLIKSNGQVKEL